MNEQCQTCLFFQSDKNKRTGTCRRNPPEPVILRDPDNRPITSWECPTMNFDDWCGEYRSRTAIVPFDATRPDWVDIPPAPTTDPFVLDLQKRFPPASRRACCDPASGFVHPSAGP